MKTTFLFGGSYAASVGTTGRFTASAGAITTVPTATLNNSGRISSNSVKLNGPIGFDTGYVPKGDFTALVAWHPRDPAPGTAPTAEAVGVCGCGNVGATIPAIPWLYAPVGVTSQAFRALHGAFLTFDGPGQIYTGPQIWAVRLQGQVYSVIHNNHGPRHTQTTIAAVMANNTLTFGVGGHGYTWSPDTSEPETFYGCVIYDEALTNEKMQSEINDLRKTLTSRGIEFPDQN